MPPMYHDAVEAFASLVMVRVRVRVSLPLTLFIYRTITKSWLATTTLTEGWLDTKSTAVENWTDRGLVHVESRGTSLGSGFQRQGQGQRLMS